MTAHRDVKLQARTCNSLFAVALLTSVVVFAPREVRAQTRAAGPSAVGVSYAALAKQAKSQLANHLPQPAQASAERAIRLEPQRYEAHILAATALRDQKRYADATNHLHTAFSLAPEDFRPEILRAITELRVAALPPDGRRRLDALMLIVEDARKATGYERMNFMEEFLGRSDDFIIDYFSVPDLLVLRAAVSIETNDPEGAWMNVNRLKELGFTDTHDPAVRNLLAQLERKGWLDPAVRARIKDERRRAYEDRLAAIQRERRAVADGVADAKSTVDTAERLKKLIALDAQYPNDEVITAERRLALQAVRDELPRDIARFLNSLGKMQFNTNDVVAESSIEYTAEAQRCGLILKSSEWLYFRDRDYSHSETRVDIDFSHNVVSDDLAEVGSNNNPALFVSGDETVLTTSFRKRDKPQLTQGTQSTPNSYIAFPPGRRADAKQLLDKFVALQRACASQDQ